MGSTLHRMTLLAVAACALALAACNAVTNAGRTTAPAAKANVLLTGTANGLGGEPLVLQNNGANDHSFTNPISTVAATSPISFGAVPKGSAYNITIKTQPYGRICTIDSATASGVANADVKNLSVTCTRDSAVPTYTVSGTVSNLVAGATGLQVKLHTEDGDEVVAVSANGALNFVSKLLPNFAYSVTVSGNPMVNGTSHSCSVTNGSGTIPPTGGANVTNVAISCSFLVGGAVTFPLVFGPAPAIASPGVSLSFNQGSTVDTLVLTATPFSYSTRKLATSDITTVSITSQPPGQTCVFKTGGTTASVLATPADVSLSLTCITSPVTASQLTGTYRLGRDAFTFFANGTFLYGAHPSSGTSGVELGFYGTVAGFTPAGGQTLYFATDSNGSGGLSNSGSDFGYVNLLNFTKTTSGITFSKVPTFGGTTTGPFTYAVASSTAGKLAGAWSSADLQRVFVYNSTDGTGFHMGVNGGAPNLQDVCLTVADPTMAAGSYTQNRVTSSCVITGGVADTDPTASSGDLYALPGGPVHGAVPTVSYAVTAGSPDALVLTPSGGTASNWTRSTPN